MVFSGGGNGHWVRTRTPEGAKAFLTEKRIEQERLAASRERSLELRRRIWSTIRSWVTRK
ncbi:MAG TPA: hypothetical protein VGP24_03510 [Glaciihabitans sp.]|nr:hypothetical protein [Glaciihabitans sp.]